MDKISATRTSSDAHFCDQAVGVPSDTALVIYVAPSSIKKTEEKSPPHWQLCFTGGAQRMSIRYNEFVLL